MKTKVTINLFISLIVCLKFSHAFNEINKLVQFPHIKRNKSGGILLEIKYNNNNNNHFW